MTVTNIFAMTANKMKRTTIPAVEAAGCDDLQAQAERLQERAHAAKFRKQADLARASGIPFQTLGSYWKGTRGMSYPNALKLAEALGNATADYLMLGRGEPSATVDAVTKMSQGQGVAATTLKIRLFEAIDVHYLVKLKNKEFFPWAKMTTISNASVVLGADYAERPEPPIAFLMPDRSMEPLIPEKARVIVLPDTEGECVSGKAVHAVVPGLNLTTIRELVIERGPDGSKKILHPLNDQSGKHKDIEMAADDFCWRAVHAVIDL